LGNNIGIAAVDQRALPARHFGLVGWLQFERRRAVFHGVGVDARDRRDVGWRSGADRYSGHGGIIPPIRQKKTPRRAAGASVTLGWARLSAGRRPRAAASGTG